MDAADEQQVRDRLVRMGFRPVAVVPAPGAAPVRPPSPAASPSRRSAAFSVSALSVGEQALLWRQLAELARAGFSPFDSFSALAARSRNGRVRAAARDVALRVRQGSPVADALAANAAVFGTDCRMAVLAGELGGFLADVYEDFARSFEDEKRHRERARWFRLFGYINLIGGLVLLHAILFFTNYLSAASLPAGSGGIMERAGGEGWPQFLGQGVSLWFRQFALVVVPALLLVFLGWPLLLSWLERGPLRPAADWLGLRIPLCRTVNRVRGLGRFYRFLRRLAAAGVAPIQSWEAAAEAVGNRAVTEALLRGRAELARGRGMGAALRAAGLAPDGDVQLLSTADQTGRIPEILLQLERDYEARWESVSRIVRYSLLGLLGLSYGAVLVYAFARFAVWYASLAGEILKDWMP
jgi:type II secretory pathway component PulF